jgi:uncharacterized membrane protein
VVVGDTETHHVNHVTLGLVVIILASIAIFVGSLIGGERSTFSPMQLEA